jgi:iron complex outermembrane receptor protein
MTAHPLQRSLLSTLAATLAAACLPLGVQAQSAEPPAGAASEAPVTLPAVQVRSGTEDETATGPALGYRAKRSATATKSDTPLIETPQSVTVVTRERIEDLGAQGLQDALNYAAGVRSDAFGLDSRSDGILVRGAYPDEYLDGLRQTFNYYTSTTRTDPYMLERIEVLRGPSAMLYGQGSTAGIVNLVSKRPLAEAQREIGLQVGTFERKQLQADFTGPLTEDGRWLYRLVALARESGTQVDFVDDDRLLLAPSLTWRPNASTSLTLQARVQRDRSGSTLQFFPWSGTVQDNPNGRIPNSRFIGEPGFDRYDSDRDSIGWLFEHRFDERWTVRQNLRVARNEVDYRTLYADSFTNPGNSYLDPAQRVVGRYAQSTLTEVRMTTLDQHLEGRLRTGGVEHQLLVGVDALRFRQTGRSSGEGPGTVPPIDVFDPVYTGYEAPPQTDDLRTAQRQVGIYLQDQMKFGDHWIVVAGLRHDRARGELEGADDDKHRATSRRLGVMYAFDAGWSPYVSYSESFTPVAAQAGRRFTPQRGEQIEAGLKYEPPGKGYSATAAVYELREENRLVQVTPTTQEQVGRTKTGGFELEVLGRIGAAFEMSAHYNYLDNDEALDGLPHHQAAVWGKQRFSLFGVPGFSVGLGVRSFSAFTDKTAPQTPSVTLTDALLAWDSPQWRYALNVQNLGDETYVSTCLPRGDCFYGAGRTATLTATYRF